MKRTLMEAVRSYADPLERSAKIAGVRVGVHLANGRLEKSADELLKKDRLTRKIAKNRKMPVAERPRSAEHTTPDPARTKNDEYMNSILRRNKKQSYRP